MKRRGIGVTVVAWLGTLLLSLSLYLLFPSFFDSIHKRANDLFFTGSSSHNSPLSITVIDIDNESLTHIGSWPWSRNVIARLIDTIRHKGAKVIGVDIVFPEPDRTSPAQLSKTLDLNLTHTEDYDDILGKSLALIPTVGGYIFSMESNTSTNLFPLTSAVIVEHGTGRLSYTLPEAKGLIPNIAPIRDHLASAGFLNIIPDSTGILRSVPLLIQYRDRIFPSLDLELLRLALDQPSVQINNGTTGLESIQIGNTTLPVDAKGLLHINFSQQGFSHIPAYRLLTQPKKTPELRGHIVLIGSSAGALQDFRATPTSTAMPGVDIHATILANALSRNTLIRPSWITGLDLLIFVAVFTIAFIVLLRINGLMIGATVTLLGLGGIWLSIRWWASSHHLVIDTLLPFWGWGLGAGVALILHYISEKRLSKETYRVLEKKVSESVAKHLIRTEQPDTHEHEVSILFSDIRHFTNMAEEIHSPKTLLELLNRYTEPMSRIIAKHHGTIDKYIGDAIMAYWNAPEPLKDHADHALRTALEQYDYLQQLNPLLEQTFGHTLSIGIGIHTGTVIMGEVGSRERSDYTLIGDNVNLAARIQELTKTYNKPIIISHATKEQLKGSYSLEKLDTVALRGKTEKVTLYAVTGENI